MPYRKSCINIVWVYCIPKQPSLLRRQQIYDKHLNINGDIKIWHNKMDCCDCFRANTLWLLLFKIDEQKHSCWCKTKFYFLVLKFGVVYLTTYKGSNNNGTTCFVWPKNGLKSINNERLKIAIVIFFLLMQNYAFLVIQQTSFMIKTTPIQNRGGGTGGDGVSRSPLKFEHDVRRVRNSCPYFCWIGTDRNLFSSLVKYWVYTLLTFWLN